MGWIHQHQSAPTVALAVIVAFWNSLSLTVVSTPERFLDGVRS